MENKKWINLDDKVVIVTGGSSGIGEQTVNDLLNCGAKVAIIDMQEPKDYKETDNLVFHKTNITNKEEVIETIKRLLINIQG